MILIEFNGPTFTKRDTIEQPFGILITIPERFFTMYPGGLKQFERVMTAVDQGKLTWGNTIAGIPKLDVEFVYLVYGGFVQYRLTILNYERNVTKEFSDGAVTRCFENKNWVNLCGPAWKPAGKYLMRGFQGFRYTVFIF